jgi:hypothetical protein
VKIPNGHRADLDAKLDEYVLNYSHREGRHKARVFEAVLGITAANQEILANGLRTAIESSDEAEFQGNNGHGDVYVLRFLLTTERGAATVLSVWIIRNGEDFPRLVSCYIL